MDTIGKYHVQRVLGHGGMGTVYEAIDPVIQRRVAVKTMMPGQADAPELRVRFLREAQAAGGLRHRNIVTVYDLGEDRGCPFIAMELVEGTDLERIIHEREDVSVEWKLDVIRQVCEGLAYAHRSGIVHRDVKPANILVKADGEVKIVDFGIAHLQSSKLTRSGLVLGTVHYMAPEQIEGHKVDHRADIFSVGAIAFELIAYKKPYDGETITGVMYRITHGEPDAAALPATAYSPALERIILRAMAREVSQRYQNLEEMLADLQALVRDTAPKIVAAAAAQAKDTLVVPTADLEHEERRRHATRRIEEGRRALGAGALDVALAAAREALELQPDDPAARQLLLDVEAESLRKRVEGEMADIRTEMDEALRSGHLPRALTLCRRLIDLDPDDAEVQRTAQAIQEAIRDREVEQLSGQALSYAADGEMELALKIAARIEKLAPDSPKALELSAYLRDEARRREADVFTAEAQEHLVHGALAEARSAAERALKAYPEHALAREIRDRAHQVLSRRAKPVPSPATPAAVPQSPPAPVAAAAPAPVVSPKPAPIPSATPPLPALLPPPAAAAAPAALAPAPLPAVPAARPAAPAAASAPRPAAVAPPPPAGDRPAARPSVAARAVSATATPPPVSSPLPVPPSPPQPPATTLIVAPDAAPPVAPPPAPVRIRAGAEPPGPATPPAGDADALAESALRHFLANNNAKARKAAEKALAIEPGNKKARELMKILGSLG